MTEQERTIRFEEHLLTATQLLLRTLEIMQDLAENVVRLETRIALLESRHAQNS